MDTISLQLKIGQVMGLIGENGAGKSTLIRLLMGFLQPDSGCIHLLGHNMRHEHAAAKAHIGYVSEDMGLYGDADLGWHMGFSASVYPAWDHAYAELLLKRFALTVEMKPNAMSRGERIKASLLLAFARKPSLLILDEPMTGLDPVARQEVISAMMDVVAEENRSILFSSHHMEDVERLSDQICLMEKGRLSVNQDTTHFLDRWRRIRLRLSSQRQLSLVKGFQLMRANGSLAVGISSDFSDETIKVLQESGGKIEAVERMTLEEIFNSRQSSTEERTAA
ncbi:ABC transporter ATP-binding protein [Kordiimonas sp. SCSIO 12610]|nr:ABC transporter ATP-binding protein [Kordiimonas sp. SCSIO 12610]